MAKTHGHSQTKLYKVWKNMRARCVNPRSTFYADYGGRGIRVCDRWNSFENFVADMGWPPKGMTLERIDNDGDYEPDNCRYASRRDQSRNRRSNILLTHDGKTMTATEWGEYLGIKPMTIRFRWHAGWPTERILRRPVYAGQFKLSDEELVEISGLLGNESNTSLARRFGVSQATISNIRTGKTAWYVQKLKECEQ